MINKRLIGTVKESKKYIALNVAIQWCSLAANVVMMAAISVLLASMAEKKCHKDKNLYNYNNSGGSGCHKISVCGRDVQDELSFIKGSKENTA